MPFIISNYGNICDILLLGCIKKIAYLGSYFLMDKFRKIQKYSNLKKKHQK